MKFCGVMQIKCIPIKCKKKGGGGRRRLGRYKNGDKMQPNETGWKTLAITHLQAASDELIHCRHTLELGESDCKDGMQRKNKFQWSL